MEKATEQRRQESLKRILSTEFEELRQQLKQLQLDCSDAETNCAGISDPKENTQPTKELLNAHATQLLHSCEEQRIICQGIYNALIKLIGEVGQPRDDNIMCIKQLCDFTKELKDQEKIFFPKIELLHNLKQNFDQLQVAQVKELEKWSKAQKEHVEGVERLLLTSLHQQKSQGIKSLSELAKHVNKKFNVYHISGEPLLDTDKKLTNEKAMHSQEPICKGHHSDALAKAIVPEKVQHDFTLHQYESIKEAENEEEPMYEEIYVHDEDVPPPLPPKGYHGPEKTAGDLPSNTKDNLPCKDSSVLSNIVTCESGVVVKDSVKLVFPPGAVDNPVSVNIMLEDPSKYYGLIVQKDLENNVMFAAPIVNLEPSGYIFNKRFKLVSKVKVANFKWDDLAILHGSRAKDGKIIWRDITCNSRIDEENAEVVIEIAHFSLVAILVRFSRSTVIRTKEIVSRLNLLAFNYTLSVLLNKSSPSPVHDELALLFVSQDVYCEQFYREDENSSALMQLKKEGFVELHVCSITRQEETSIYNHENLHISVHLGEDYKLADRQQKESSFTVDSDVWWNAGKVIRLPLEWRKDVRSLCGEISVKGDYGHTSNRQFSERDLCGYVSSLLGVQGAIFNLIPIAQLLDMPKESMSQVTKCWKDENDQLELILQRRKKKNDDVVKDLAALRNDLESLQQEDYMLTKRGQMHIRHLRNLATKIGGLQCVNADSDSYFVHKIQTLCKSVLRDCCIELKRSIEDVDGEDLFNYAMYLVNSICIHSPLPEEIIPSIARKYQQVCSSSEKAIIKIFLIIFPYLIQNIKDIFVDKKEVPQNGLSGLSKEKLDHFVSSVRNAEGNHRFYELVCEFCNILEQLCLENHDTQPTEEIEKWGESVAILPMLNFLKPFFQHSCQDVKLHQRLDLFSRRLRDIMANREDIDGVVVHDLSNLLLSLIHFAKFDPSKLVRFELNDSTNSSKLTCSSENVRYNKREHTYSQVFRIKKELKDELQLHSIARVYINGKLCMKGTFQSEIILKASSEEAFNECSNHFDDVTVVKLEDIDSEHFRVVLCATQKEKLSELLDVLKEELRENVDLNQSEVTQCRLTMRTVTTKADVDVNLRLVYKWGSDAIFLDSKDFVTFADLSTGCLCTPEVQVADLSKEQILLEQQLTLAADKQPEDGSTTRENNVASRDMQIFIKMMDGTKEALTVKAKDLILDVKKKVQQLNECPPDRQRLVFAGKKLEDDHTLRDYNVQSGSTLSLVLRLVFSWKTPAETILKNV